MAITRFDDGSLPTLLGYWSAAESIVNMKTVGDDDVVDSIEMAYGDFDPPLTLVSDGSAEIYLTTPVESVMPELYMQAGVATNAGRVVGTLGSQYALGNNYSVMLLMRIPEITTRAGTHYIGGSLREDDQVNLNHTYLAVDDNSTVMRIRPGPGGSTYTPSAAAVTTATTWCYTSNSTTGIRLVYQDGAPSVSGDLTGAALNNMQQVVMLGSPANDGEAQVALSSAAIMVIYAAPLTESQVFDVNELMKYWEANGTGPNTDTPATVSDPSPASQSVESPAGTSFSAAPAGQPAPTMQWKATKSADTATPGNWANADTVLGGNVGATNIGTLNINSTVPADDGVKLEMWVTNSGATDVRPSTHATLNVSTTTHPTTATFGPVLTTDPTNSTLTWQYQHSTAGWVAWNDAAHPISSTGVNASVNTDGQQAGNILDINAATTPQTVLIQCQATANYQPEGITSNQYTLIIEAES